MSDREITLSLDEYEKLKNDYIKVGIKIGLWRSAYLALKSENDLETKVCEEAAAYLLHLASKEEK